MPEIGYPESHYARRVRQADLEGDQHAHEAYKTAQYITLAIGQRAPWEEKLRYFRHALRRHCNPPPLPSDEVWLFYKELANLVRSYAGRVALEIALAKDEELAHRQRMGVTMERLAYDAETFFARVLGHQDHCPEHFNDDDWDQLNLIRKQWIVKM
jgi:hypothetical protein